MNDGDDILSAVDALKDGQIIAYPTEAVWGLGCDPYNADAFQKLLQLKQRPIEKGVILLASDIAQIDFLLHNLEPDIYQQMLNSWQHQHNQAVTWLIPTHSRIPTWITGQHQQVAVRVSQHPLCQALCRAFDGFIVSTSANPSNLPPAESYPQCFSYFVDNIHYLHGETGGFTRPSRIIDAITGNIIRA